MRALGLVFLFLLANGVQVDAQEPSFDELKVRFPDQRRVCLHHDREVQLDVLKNELYYAERLDEAYMCLTEGVSVFSDESIVYSEFSKITDIKAESQVLNDKGKYKTLKVSEFKERDEFTDGIFSDDLRSINFRYPGLDVGTRYSLTYTREHFLKQATSRFYFFSGSPMLTSTYRIVADPSVTVRWKLFNMEEMDFTFREYEEKGKRIYEWQVMDLDRVVVDEDAPAFSHWVPHIATYVESYRTKEGEVRVLGTPDDLFEWYNGFINEVDLEQCVNVAAIVDSIFLPDDSDEMKVRKIFRWVQDNIKYVAVENGLGGFIPRDPEAVCTKKYGDCKDMATLMHAMCNRAGIESYLTWVGTRDIPYRYDELPTPAVDNHMILAYGDPNAPLWLDATNPTGEFGVPTSFIQGKEAMLRIPGRGYTVVEVPEMESNYNTVTERLSLNIDGDTLRGNGTMAFHGYYRDNFQSIVNDIDSDEDVLEDFVAGYVEKGSNKYKLEGFKLDLPETHSGSANLTFDFHIPSFVLALDDEVIVNLNLEKYYADYQLKSDRTLPREFRFRSKIDSEIRMLIPEGYHVKDLPNDENYLHEDFSFSYTYVIEDDEIVLRQLIDIDTLALLPEQFQAWNQMIDMMKSFYRQSVVFSKI